MCKEIKKKEEITQDLSKRFKNAIENKLLEKEYKLARDLENQLKNNIRSLFETYFKEDLEFLKGKYVKLKADYKAILQEKEIMINKLNKLEKGVKIEEKTLIITPKNQDKWAEAIQQENIRGEEKVKKKELNINEP